jgi:micrococcal nuclease
MDLSMSINCFLNLRGIMFEYRIKQVLKVVDGDTVDVDIDLGFSISYSQRLRLAGIDTPESRTKDKFEKTLGLESKEYLRSKLKDSEFILVKTEKPDSTEKYGRILGWIYVNGETKSLNEQMIEDGYAWVYMGETKVKDFSALAEKRKRSGK